MSHQAQEKDGASELEIVMFTSDMGICSFVEREFE
jgi:hypothetical protein